MNDPHTLHVVGYGGGTNSTAMLIGMHYHGIRPDRILFADTGCEQPHTYAYLPVMEGWLKAHGFPEITRLRYTDQNGMIQTLEEECLRTASLPSIAYGYKKCSLKYKVGVQDKFCNNDPICQKIWAQGGKVTKYIGYDAGEERRRTHAIVYDIVDKKYTSVYPLIDDWDWSREDCIRVIEQEGLPLPGKSSCFFCPSMKKQEIRTLYHQHRDLYERAIAIEKNAQPNLISVRGLGRNWSWQDFVEADINQTVLCSMFPETNMPCGCYDGD